MPSTNQIVTVASVASVVTDSTGVPALASAAESAIETKRLASMKPGSVTGWDVAGVVRAPAADGGSA